jgi:hypothetical protein
MRYRLGFLVAIGFLFGQVAFGATELITNGGFEVSSGAPWQVSGALAAVPVVVNQPVAHSGNAYLQIGNVNGTNSQGVFQTITIPTNTLVARFSYFWGCSIGTSPNTDPTGADQFNSLIVLNGNGVSLDQQSSANIGYQPASIDLTGYAGKTVQIGFLVQELTLGFGVRTFFAVDDVSLVSFTPDDVPANDNFTSATLLATTTNISVLATNVLATKEPGEPKHAGAVGGHSVWWKWTAPGNGAVIINTSGSTFNTVLGVYTGTTVSNLTPVAANDDVDSGRGIFTSQVKTLVTAGTEYEIAVDGKGGASGVVQLNLSFSADTKAPTVAITSPKSGAKLTNSTVVVHGTASDNLAVAQVQFRLENAAGTNDYQNADGTNSWTATVTGLIPGPNTIRVRAFDTSSNQSVTPASTVTFVVVSPLTVNVTGSGTVTPNLNNTLQDVGTTLTLTAKPAAGQVFANWTGDTSATTAKLTFVMQSNMVLNANFVPNPFIPVTGGYQGLFLDTNGPVPQSSGAITLSLANAGSFSAKILLAGKSSSLSGQFSADGSFSNNIVRKGLTPLSVQLNLDFQNSIITGFVSDGTFNAQLLAAHVLTSAGTAAGSYTLLIPGSADGVAQPGGDGYATVKIAPTGAISLTGALADGSKITQKATLILGANWAFYVPLYAGKGSISGFLHLTNIVDNDISGDLLWAKLPAAGGTFYPGGFTFFSNPVGSTYHSPSQLWLANGNLANSFTNQIAMDSASKITSTNSTLKLKLTTSTGMFKGSVVNPDTGKAVPFSGVVLQNRNFGGGFFTGTNQTGRVFLGP